MLDVCVQPERARLEVLTNAMNDRSKAKDSMFGRATEVRNLSAEPAGLCWICQ